MIEQKINQFFGDAESTGFGTGWWSAILSAFFGFLAFGGVLCLHFPQLLTDPELRPYYPMHVIRLLIQGLIVGAFAFGVIASILRKKKILALTGMFLALAATVLGGSSVRINQNLHNGPAIGLDWFLLDMLLMAIIYVPIERLWPQYPEQGTFRKDWTLDVVYFMSTHWPIQILSFLVLLPATQAVKYLGVPVLQHSIARLPWLCNSFWLLWLPMLRNTSFTSRCTKCLFCGASTPFTILRSSSIGSQVRVLILWTTRWCADSSLRHSCSDFRSRSFSRI